MRRSNSYLVILFCLFSAAPLMAQDFGKGWIERISHELIEDEPELSPHPAEFKFTGGELYSYDSNIFLTHTGRTDSSIFTTFVGGNLKYAQPSFDAEADLLLNYNAYVSNSDVDADEERFFGRVRYQGTQVTLALAEVARRETSPTDVVFTTRVSRFLSNTTPLVVFKLSEVFAIELQSDLQYVDYLRSTFSFSDNFNSRTLLTLAYTTGWNNIDLLVQGGYWDVNYRESTSPPDANGYIARGGIRGEVSPNWNVVALVGISTADSQDFPGTNKDVSMSTMDAEIHIAYKPRENVTLYADYSRRFGFSTGAAPFEVVDMAGLNLELTPREDLTLRTRFDYSRASEPGVLRRAYYDFAMGAEYKIHPHVALDGGIAYRWGVTPGSGGAGNFGDAILSIGAAVLF
jgi:hypothetical protein